MWLVSQDLTAINVTKTGHKKKLLSESSKLQSDEFPHERPVSMGAPVYDTESKYGVEFE